MRITSKAISNRIHFKLGIPHIEVFPNYQKGYCFFYSDHEPTAEWLSLWYSTSVDVVALNRLSLDEWVQAFKNLMPKIIERGVKSFGQKDEHIHYVDEDFFENIK